MQDLEETADSWDMIGWVQVEGGVKSGVSSPFTRGKEAAGTENAPNFSQDCRIVRDLKAWLKT